MYKHPVFVDMDGVVTEFCQGAAKVFGKDPDLFQRCKGAYAIEHLFDVSPIQFWGALDKEETFWINLEKTAEADSLFDLLEALVPENNIYFLSSPAIDPKCHYGKAQWIQKHFPKYINRLILTGHKHFLAAPHRVLIDDSDKNTHAFALAGGRGLLFPRPWNKDFSVAALGSEEAFRRFSNLLRATLR